MIGFIFFYEKFYELRSFLHDNFLNHKAKDVFIVEAIFFLQDVYEGFNHVVCIRCHIAETDQNIQFDWFFDGKGVWMQFEKNFFLVVLIIFGFESFALPGLIHGQWFNFYSV